MIEEENFAFCGLQSRSMKKSSTKKGFSQGVHHQHLQNMPDNGGYKVDSCERWGWLENFDPTNINKLCLPKTCGSLQNKHAMACFRGLSMDSLTGMTGNTLYISPPSGVVTLMVLRQWVMRGFHSGFGWAGQVNLLTLRKKSSPICAFDGSLACLWRMAHARCSLFFFDP